jgi:hypothetical protein
MELCTLCVMQKGVSGRYVRELKEAIANNDRAEIEELSRYGVVEDGEEAMTRHLDKYHPTRLSSRRASDRS